MNGLAVDDQFRKKLPQALPPRTKDSPRNGDEIVVNSWTWDNKATSSTMSWRPARVARGVDTRTGFDQILNTFQVAFSRKTIELVVLYGMQLFVVVVGHASKGRSPAVGSHRELFVGEQA